MSMLRLADYDIVFQEVPGEVSLALNISGCPNRCPGCHSPHLQRQVGEPLDEATLGGLVDRYGGAVTCVCFMGGDAAPAEVARLAAFVRETTSQRLKTAWYSGRDRLPDGFALSWFDHVKLGPFIAALGGLDSPTTNQRFYRATDDGLVDITELFRRGK
ncbi:hypothetical protein FACS1894159_03920 [Bacteroidia bacterium]|nr:hypothetical protein FACS1894159_03920 [Bacteroidia bacterium]